MVDILRLPREADGVTFVGNNFRDGMIYCAFFFVDCVLLSLFMHHVNHQAMKSAIRMRSCLFEVLMRKSLRLRDIELHRSEVLRLASADCQQVYEGAMLVPHTWPGVLEAFAIVFVLFGMIGWPAVFCVALLIIVVSLLTWAGHRLMKLRLEFTRSSELRQRDFHELLTCIKQVKFYGWEAPLIARLRTQRLVERQILTRAGAVKAVALASVFSVPVMVALVMFGTLVAQGEELKATLVFTTLSMFNTLRLPLGQLPRAVRAVSGALQAIKNIEHFMSYPEVLGVALSTPMRAAIDGGDESNSKPDFSLTGPAPTIEFSDVTLGRFDAKELVSGLNFRIHAGGLLAVVGTVGSGKTAVLASLLSESTVTRGKLTLDGAEATEAWRHIAYLPQTPWLLSASVRDNITFGLPFDEERYQAVVSGACLQFDFANWPEGDRTMVSELGGSNISGGQRQRVGIARVLYSTAPLVVLDSPLSAVDPRTARRIMEGGIKQLLRGRTVLMSTNSLAEVRCCDRVVMIDAQGKQCYFGGFDPRKMAKHYPPGALDDALAEQAAEDKATSRAASGTASNVVVPADIVAVKDNVDEKKVAEAEKVPEQPLERHIRPRNDGMRRWIRYTGTALMSFWAFEAAIVQIVRVLSDYWLRWWVEDEHGLTQNAYIGIYAGLVAGFILLMLVRGFLFYRLSANASVRTAKRFVTCVALADMRYFCKTPIGHLLSTFAKDQDNVDEALPDAVHMFVIYLFILIGTLTLVAIQQPWFIFLAVGLFLFWFGIIAITSPSTAALKHLLGVAYSNVTNHMSDTLQGASVVRSFGAYKLFTDKLGIYVDEQRRRRYALEVHLLGVGTIFDMLGIIAATGSCFLCFGLGLTAASGGLAISNSIQVLMFFTMMSKCYNDIRTHLHSMERIDAHTDRAEQHPDELEPSQAAYNDYVVDTPKSIKAFVDKTSVAPASLPADWPATGQLTFEDCVMSYIPGTPPALRGSNFRVDVGEKIGVVGRTGSGKTTSAIALFRLYPLTSGRIMLDGVDVGTLPLPVLRRRLGIVPQQPFIFSGSLRFNLDPLGEHDDQRLWGVVDAFTLRPVIELLEKNTNQKAGLDIWLSPERLSLGQRQMMCLARAALRCRGLLVLDEATAALDMISDRDVQVALRKSDFVKRATVLAVAHRVHSVIDSNRILVMNAGKVAEFEPPLKLVKKPTSLFRQLCDAAGISPAGAKTLADAWKSVGDAERSPEPATKKQQKTSKKSSKAKADANDDDGDVEEEKNARKEEESGEDAATEDAEPQAKPKKAKKAKKAKMAKKAKKDEA